MAKNNQVNISINWKDNASKSFKQVEKSAWGLWWKLSWMRSKIAWVGWAITKVGWAVIWAWAAFWAWVLALWKIWAESNSVSLAFWRMTKNMSIDSENLMKTLRKTSKWAIDDTSLQLAANKAMSLGVWNSVEEMSTLMEIARVKAKNMWLSTQQAFDDIVTWLWRWSPMILDNLWITVKVWEANEEYAKKLWKVATELTSAEQKQALVNYVVSRWKDELNAMWDVWVDSAERFQQFQATLSNVKSTIWEWLLPVFNTVLNTLQPIIDKVAENIKLWFQNKENVEKLTLVMQWVIKVFWFLFEAIWKAIWFLTKMWEMLWFVAFKVIEFSKNVVNWFWDMKDKVVETWTNLKTNTLNLVTWIRDWAIQKFNNFKEWLANIWENIKTSTNEAWTNIKEWVVWFASSIYTWVVDKFTWMLDKVKAIYDKIKNWLWWILWMNDEANNASSNVENIANTSWTWSLASWSRATGWSVIWWSSYLVWENGPEIFTPNTSWNISNQTSQVVNINFSWNLWNESDRRNMIDEIKRALSRDLQYSSYWIN